MLSHHGARRCYDPACHVHPARSPRRPSPARGTRARPLPSPARWIAIWPRSPRPSSTDASVASSLRTPASSTRAPSPPGRTARSSARPYDVVVLVGPPHRVGFDGVAVYPAARSTRRSDRRAIAEDVARRLLAASPVVRDYPAAHAREHSLEMQLPFLRRVLPDVPIVPLVMGYQTPATIRDARRRRSRARSPAARRCSWPAATCRTISTRGRHPPSTRWSSTSSDGFDADGLLRVLDEEPHHACGGGPIVSVMRGGSRARRPRRPRAQVRRLRRRLGRQERGRRLHGGGVRRVRLVTRRPE